MDDSNEPERPRTGSLIHRTAAWDERSGDRQAEQANDPSNERWSEAGHRDQQTTLQAGKGRRTAEHTTCWSVIGAWETEWFITIWKWEQIKESSHTRKYKTCAHTGHMTFILGMSASGDNEPACLFPTSFVPFFFSCQTKTPLIIEYKWEEVEWKKKISMVPFLWKMKRF